MVGALLLASLASAGKVAPLWLEDGRPVAQRVELHLDPESTRTRGSTELRVDLEGKRGSIRLNATDLRITAAELLDGQATAPVEWDRVDAHTVELRFPKQDGEIVVKLDFEGSVSDLETQGLFRQEDRGEHYLFTQFEPYSARTVFPCFDQPGHKIPFTLALTVPEDDLAFSNAPVAKEDVRGGKRTVEFAPTRPLPTYLLAFAVGPFDVVEGAPAPAHERKPPQLDVPVRILAPRGRADEAAFAAEITGPILDWQQRWFDRSYLYDKLDVVALPLTVGFGAMEHPGLVTITADVALAPAERDTEDRRRDYVAIMAHELAHQWFGNQVTPRWWDDLWLNESFATWMEGPTLAGIYPDETPDVDRVADREGAMALDSLTTVRRIREPIVALEDIESAFDGITYGKGAQVLAMTEAWLGPEDFRSGVRRYLDAHAHGTATTDDFVVAVSDAATRDAGGVFTDFLDQPGVPLVRAERICEPEPRVRLTVERYLPGRATQSTTWRVPVCIREVATEGAERTCVLVEGRAAELPLVGACDTPVLFNDGMTGYYRTAVRADELTALLDSGGLTTAETVGLIGDASAMVAKGELEPAVVLEALPRLLELDQPDVTRATLDVAVALDAHLVPNDLRPNYERFLRQTYRPLLDQLGIDPVEGESEDDRVLRSELIAVVGGLGRDPELVALATERARVWIQTDTGLDPEILDPILEVAARYGDLELYDELRARAEATEDRTARGTLLGALGAFRLEEAARRNLEWAMSKDLDIREAAPLFFGAFSDRKLRPFAWDFTREHIDDLEKMVPAVARGYLIWSGAGFCDAERRAEVEAFFGPRAKRYLGGKRILSNVLEGIDVCVVTTEAQREPVRAFLEGF